MLKVQSSEYALHKYLLNKYCIPFTLRLKPLIHFSISKIKIQLTINNITVYYGSIIFFLHGVQNSAHFEIDAFLHLKHW